MSGDNPDIVFYNTECQPLRATQSVTCQWHVVDYCYGLFVDELEILMALPEECWNMGWNSGWE